MTDKEIIKALECVPKRILTENEATALEDALDLINRQQAEIGRLTTLSELGKTRANDYRVMRDRALKAEAEVERLKAGVNVELENYASEYDSKIKAEAIKEYIERCVCRLGCGPGDDKEELYVCGDDFLEIMKEIVGEQE